MLKHISSVQYSWELRIKRERSFSASCVNVVSFNFRHFYFFILNLYLITEYLYFKWKVKIITYVEQKINKKQKYSTLRIWNINNEYIQKRNIKNKWNSQNRNNEFPMGNMPNLVYFLINNEKKILHVSRTTRSDK